MRALATAAMAAVLATGCGGGAQTVVGLMTLQDREGWTESAGSCAGDGGYSDIRGGTQVQVTDGSGELIATSRLDPGERRGRFCDFPFEVEIPGGHDFYVFEVANRGTLSFSADELAEVGYSVGFSLGG